MEWKFHRTSSLLEWFSMIWMMSPSQSNGSSRLIVLLILQLLGWCSISFAGKFFDNSSWLLPIEYSKISLLLSFAVWSLFFRGQLRVGCLGRCQTKHTIIVEIQNIAIEGFARLGLGVQRLLPSILGFWKHQSKLFLALVGLISACSALTSTYELHTHFPQFTSIHKLWFILLPDVEHLTVNDKSWKRALLITFFLQ